jgi:hypothetical protein
MKNITYMVIEKYRNGGPKPVYRRFREKGRMATEGLNYVSSWINEEITICYQIMETSDRSLIDAWIDNWKDIVDFEVFPVITSKEALDKIAPYL